MNGWLTGLVGVWMGGRTGRWMGVGDRWVDAWSGLMMDRWMYKWTERQVHGCIDRRMDR